MDPFLAAHIADRLSAEGWAAVPSFLPDAEVTACAAEVRALHASGAFRQAKVGRGPSRQLRPEIRSDHVLWLDPADATPLQRGYFDRMEALRLALNEHLFLGLFGFEAHLAQYPPGAFYRRHLDVFADARNRTLSTVLYLNETWRDIDGGFLRLFVPHEGGEAVHDIAPVGGTLAVFLADRIEHEVLPAARERLSVTGWFLRRG